MIKLMNSAMMPVPGTYNCEKISLDEFIQELKEAHAQGQVESYIGYPQNIELLKDWTGIEFELSRGQTSLEDGDVMLVMKLKYRMASPSDKGKEVDSSDFEFYRIKYSSK